MLPIQLGLAEVVFFVFDCGKPRFRMFKHHFVLCNYLEQLLFFPTDFLNSDEFLMK